MEGNSVAKLDEQSNNDQLFNRAPIAPQVNQPVEVSQGAEDVVKQQILSQVPALSDADVAKVADLIGIIKRADIKAAGQLMSLPEYKTAKNESFPEGLPEGVTPKLLFDIGKSSGSENTAADAMSQVQE